MESIEKSVIIFILGTLSLLVLSMSVIVFFVIYQKKIAKKHYEMMEKDVQHQRNLTSAVIQTREKEQRRIAEELHDNVGSQLTTIKFGIAGLNISPEEKELMTKNLQDTINNVRKLSNELLPSVLDQFGLIDAIGNQIQIFNQTNILDADFKHDLDVSLLNETQQLGLYRLFQELTNNIIKYANAKTLLIQLNYDQSANNVVLEIKDDGDGFKPTKADIQKSNSLGLKNIESRIQLLNASIEYLPNKNKGTNTIITCPL